MQGKTFHYDLDILERHLDTFGHVNNAKYLEIYEEARWAIITGNGFGLEEIRTTGLGPIILGVTVKFRRELKLRETIRVSTTIVKYERKVGTLRQTITNAKGELASEADFTIGLFDTIARKLVGPTEEWLKAFGAV